MCKLPMRGIGYGQWGAGKGRVTHPFVTLSIVDMPYSCPNEELSNQSRRQRPACADASDSVTNRLNATQNLLNSRRLGDLKTSNDIIMCE